MNPLIIVAPNNLLFKLQLINFERQAKYKEKNENKNNALSFHNNQ